MNSIQIGKGVLGIMWQKIAKDVIEKAIQIYELNDEQAAALMQVFFRKGDYIILES